MKQLSKREGKSSAKMNEQVKDIFIIETRCYTPLCHGSYIMESDAVSFHSTLEAARAWITKAVNDKMFNTEFETRQWWFAVIADKLDAPYDQFALTTSLVDTISKDGEDMKGNQPSYER